jgi:hypothetical protein
MRFYVLVSQHPWCLEQALKYLPNDRTQVVINSLDETMIPRLQNCCNWYKFPYVVTESDGTPATGKNSMMEIFRQSDDEYGVFIDGDDIVTPAGVRYYTELSKRKDAPDVLALYKQCAITSPHTVEMYDGMIADEFPDTCKLHYPMDKSQDNIHLATVEELYGLIKQIYGDAEMAERYAPVRYKFQKIMNVYCEEFEYMNRMVWFSQKGAKYVQYDNNLVVGEDTVQFMKLKKLSQEGKLRMFSKKDGHDVPPTYIMNHTLPGVSRPKDTDYEWMIPFCDELVKMIDNDEMPIPEISLPKYLT